MKISDIKFYKLKSGVTIVSLTGENGIEGLGQFINFSFNSQINYFEENLKSKLINQKIEIKKFWDKFYWQSNGRNGWIQVISAIDIALNDLIAKSKKKNLASYLNFKLKKKNQMYWSIGHGYKKKTNEMQNKIEDGMKLGFKAFKIRMDWHEWRTDVDPQKDYKMVKVIRKMLPSSYYLGFDANGGYSEKMAIYQGKKLEDLGGISHFEEPVATNNLFALKKVVDNLDIKVSFGEYEKTSSRFEEIIKLANPTILQPDLLNIGGIGEMVKIFKLAKKNKKLIMPHSPDIGILCFASLHLASNYSNLPHEFSPEIYKFQMGKHNQIFNEDILPKNGYINLIEDRYGIGLTLNKKELKKQLV